MKRYLAGSRYGYGAIDLYEVPATEPNEYRGSCLRTVVAGITQKLSRSLAIELNCAYAEGRRDMLADLVSTSQIAELAKVSKQAVSNWTLRHETFPKPLTVLAGNPVYSREAVEVWLRDNPRPQRKRKQHLVPEAF